MPVKTKILMLFAIPLVAALWLARSGSAVADTPPPASTTQNQQRQTNVPVMHDFEQSMKSLQLDMNRLFRNFFKKNNAAQWPPEEGWAMSLEGFPVLDVIDNDKTFIIQADLPGRDADSINVSVTGDYVTIQGKAAASEEENNNNYLLHEADRDAFQRVVTLPDTADAAKAEASFKDGVLTITVPKKAGTEEKSRNITIKKVG